MENESFLYSFEEDGDDLLNDMFYVSSQTPQAVSSTKRKEPPDDSPLWDDRQNTKRRHTSINPTSKFADDGSTLNFNDIHDISKAIYSSMRLPFNTRSNHNEYTKSNEMDVRCIHTNPIEEGMSLRCVGYNNNDRPLYMKIFEDHEREEMKRETVGVQLRRDKGIERSAIGELLRSIEEEELRKLQAQTEDVDATTEGYVVENDVEMDTLNPELDVVNRKMWVDKHRPKYFSELLSDEKMNLEVLSWLKSWETFVFKKRPFADNKKTFADQPKTNESDDALNGQHRVMLIGGPPGAGKTTLVQVVARHCGYEILEINASDDRTKDSFLRLVRGAVCTAGVGIQKTAKKSSIGSRKTIDVQAKYKTTKWKERATLCVLEEIDGISSSRDGKGDEAKDAISMLVNLINEKDHKGRPVIKRPIICICNDLWGKALRPLRDKCKFMMISSPTELSLQQRIDSIIRSEKLEAEPHFATRLIRLHSSDIRACINTLEFISRDKYTMENKRLMSSDLEAYSFIQDKEHDKLELLNMTFCSRSVKATHAGRGQQFNRLTEYILTNATSTSNQRFLSAFEENYYLATYTDTRLEKTAYLLELLSQGDCLTSLDYLGSSTSSTHACLPLYLFASACCSTTFSQKWKLGGMNRDWIASREMHGRKNALTTICKQAVPQVTSQLLKKSFTSDVGQVLVNLMVPDKSLQHKIWYKYKKYLQEFKRNRFTRIIGPESGMCEVLSSDAEEAKGIQNFFKIVGLLCTYSVQFAETYSTKQQVRKEATSQVYELDPPLHLLCTFDCKEPVTPYSTAPAASTDKRFTSFPTAALCECLNAAKSTLNRNKCSHISLTAQIRAAFIAGWRVEWDDDTVDAEPLEAYADKENGNAHEAVETARLQPSNLNFFDLMQKERNFAKAIVRYAGIKTLCNSLDSSKTNPVHTTSSKASYHITPAPVLELPTNGYIKYEMGRCNAVRSSLTLNF